MWSSTVSLAFRFWRFLALIPQVAQLLKQHNKWKSSAVKPRFWRNGRPTYWGHEQQWWQQRANIIPFTGPSLGAIFNLLRSLYFKKSDVKVLVCEGCGTILKCKTNICFSWKFIFQWIVLLSKQVTCGISRVPSVSYFENSRGKIFFK